MGEKIQIDKVLLDELGISKEEEKTIRDNLALFDQFLKVYESRIDDPMLISDSYIRAIISAIAEILVFAKILVFERIRQGKLFQKWGIKCPII